MPVEKVSKYLTSNVRTPYFLVVGDDQYQDVKDKMSELGLNIIKVRITAEMMIDRLTLMDCLNS